jgi:hypothetical protein
MAVFRHTVPILALALFSSALAQPAGEYPFDIPAQSLDAALTKLARQTDLQLIYPAELVREKTSNPVEGTMSVQSALERLLASSSLRPVFMDAHTVTISISRPEEGGPPGGAGPPRQLGKPPAADSTSTVRPESLPSVTVIAPPLPDPTTVRGDSVSRFVASHGKPQALTGLQTRWDVGICPRTQGLLPELNSFVTERIQALASHVGVESQSNTDCASHRSRGEFALNPNIMVIFTHQPQKLLDDIASHRVELLGFHYPNETRKLKVVDRPIQAWYVTATSSGGTPQAAIGREWIDDIFSTVPPGSLGSRLSSGQQSLFVFVLIVADVDKIQGYKVGSLADYIAVLALSRLRSLENCGRLASIIDLLSPTCPASQKPEAITAGDVAYLKALYRLKGGLTPELQRSGIEIEMTRQLLPH